MDLEQRIRMAAESILENETLREGLDDDAASALLDWGVAQAKQIAGDTAGLEDEVEIEEAMDPRIRGLRRILRAVTSLYTEENIEPGRQTELLQDIVDQAPHVYGPTGVYSTEELVHFLAAQSGSVAEKISGLRTLIEEKTK